MRIDLILEWKKKNKLRLEDIASRTGLHFNTVDQILAGKRRRPHFTTIRLFADIMGVSVEELTSGVPEPSRRKAG